MDHIKTRIEVPITLTIIAIMLSDSVTTNWIMYKTCYLTLGYNESECALLGTQYPDNITAKLEEKVQPHATILNMSKLIMETSSMAFACFFLGNWSDKYGRKPILLLTIGGNMVAYLILAVVSAIPNISPWFILLFTIPLCFTGGIITLVALVLCYVTDITSSENRGIRMTIVHCIVTIGILIGLVSSPYLLRLYGYFIVYVIASSLIVLAWLFVFFIMRESLPNPETKDKLKNLFKISLMKETIQITFKPRDNGYRKVLLTLVPLVVLHLLSYYSDNLMLFLYLREKFQWSLENYTLYSGITIISGVFGSLLGIYILHKLLGVREAIILLICLLSMFAGTFLLEFATLNWQVYVAGTCKYFGTAISPMARSLISKIIPKDEYGKVFSFMAICESIFSPLGSPIYTVIYNNTLTTFPGAYLFLNIGFYGIAILLCIGVIAMYREEHSDAYVRLDDEAVYS